MIQTMSEIFVFYIKIWEFHAYLISRWHLGFCDVKCTPTYRGFDTFYGFYQGYIDHYSHMVGGGYDWWDNKAGGGEQSRKDLDGQYAGVNL